MSLPTAEQSGAAYERIEADLDLLTDADFLALTALIAEHTCTRRIAVSELPPF